MNTTNFPFNKVRFLSEDERKVFFSQETNYKQNFFSDSVIEKYYDYINWELYISAYFGYNLDLEEKTFKSIRDIYKRYHKYSVNCSLCESIQKRESFCKKKFSHSKFCQIYVIHLEYIKFDFEDLNDILSKLIFPPFTKNGHYYMKDSDQQRNQLLYIQLMKNNFLNKNKLFEHLLPEYPLMDADVKSMFIETMPLTKSFLLSNLDIMKSGFFMVNKNLPKETLELVEKINLLK